MRWSIDWPCFLNGHRRAQLPKSSFWSFLFSSFGSNAIFRKAYELLIAEKGPVEFLRTINIVDVSKPNVMLYQWTSMHAIDFSMCAFYYLFKKLAQLDLMRMWKGIFLDNAFYELSWFSQKNRFQVNICEHSMWIYAFWTTIWWVWNVYGLDEISQNLFKTRQFHFLKQDLQTERAHSRWIAD